MPDPDVAGTRAYQTGSRPYRARARADSIATRTAAPPGRRGHRSRVVTRTARPLGTAR
ncbi:hypothetical protein FRAHR75_10078 [Frankia sp. Hr75.2]|nr:hypothetical protein FRAHR75_10078 [Frankia sp. Hr75.2]